MLKIILSAIVLMLTLAGLPAGASTLPDYPFIHASGEAFMFVPPDFGEIDFEIVAYDATPDSATALVQQHVLEVQELLREQGLPDSDIEVRDPRREMRKESGAASLDYGVRCAVHVNVRDLDKWRAVMEPLMNMSNVDAFATTFGTTSRTSVESELLTLAIKDAQAKAEAMAKALSKKVGAAAAISSGRLKNLSTSMGLMPGDLYNGSGKRQSQNRAELLTVSMLKMSQAVDAIFRIK